MPATPARLSKLEWLAFDPDFSSWLRSLSDAQANDLAYDWRMHARPNQLIPGTPDAEETREDWLIWLLLAGRGWGKTKVGAESVREWAQDPNERILLIGATT